MWATTRTSVSTFSPAWLVRCTALRGCSAVNLTRVWLAIALAGVGVGLVLMIVFGVHAYSRFRRMNRFGARFGQRMTTLAEQAGALGERVDTLSEQVDEQTRRTVAISKRGPRGSAPEP